MENSDATILIIDENANDLITLNLLTQKAFPLSVVRIARKQQSGFEMASSGKIDVILLDIGTDEMKGIELFQKLKSEIKTLDIPVLLISSIEERDLCSFYPQRKPDGFLSKPVSEDELKQQVLAVLKTADDRKIREKKTTLLDVLIFENEAGRRREEALLEAQRLSHIGSYEHDLTSDKVSWTDEGLNVFGVEHDEDLNTIDKIHRHIHPEDREYENECIQKAILNKREVEFNYRIIASDGEIRTVNMRFNPKFDENGILTRCIGAIQDISEKLRFEKEVNQKNDWMRSLLNNTSDAVFIKDTTGRYLLFNAAAEKIVGKSEKEVIGKDDTELLPMEEALTVMAADRKIMASEKSITFKERITNAAGELSVFSTNKGPIFDVDHNLIGLFGITRDITERERALEDLTVSELRYRRLFECANEGILLVDAETGKIIDVNPYLCEMLGYPRIYYLEKTIWDVGLSWDAIANKDHLNNLQETELVRHEDFQVQTADGRNVYIEFISAVYLVKNKKVIQCSMRNITNRKEAEMALQESQRRFVAAQKVALVGNWEYTIATNTIWASEEAFDIYGIEQADYLSLSEIQKRPLPKYRKFLDDKFKGLITRQEKYDVEFEIAKANNGEVRTVYSRAVLECNSLGEASKVLGTIQDITERKRIEMELEGSKENLENLINNANAPIIVWNENYEIIRINNALETLIGRNGSEILGENLDLLFPDNQSADLMKSSIDTSGGTKTNSQEIETVHKDGSVRTVLWSISTIFNAGDKTRFSTIAQGQDITERIEAEKTILYQNYHDYLTGLYNRRFYEEELKRLDTEANLPLSIAIGNVNGIKIVNDSFGQDTGDQILVKIAEVLRRGCRVGDVISRLAGDEFAVLLPRTSADETAKIISHIKELAAKETVNSLGLSISFGYETKKSIDKNINGVIKTAEDHMNRHKLFDSSSMRSTMIDLIMNTLYEKNHREMLHSKRVSALCEAIASKMNFDTDDINQIKTAGLLHDIGKIGIDENILNSTQKLSDEEWKEIKKHSEIGYRILSSVVEFSGIAEFILNHHERWDGNGYPQGLKGEEIARPSRIITLADSYDAMTAERTYRGLLDKKAASEEIKRCAGTQFDPDIAKVFVVDVLEEAW